MAWEPALVALAVGLGGTLVILFVGVLVLAAVDPIAAWIDDRLHPRRLPPARPPSATVRAMACGLQRGALVLTPSTPFRFRMERVLWLEQQPLGPVVAVLEGTDPDSLQIQQRWHQWRPQERITVLTGPVEIEDYSGDYGGLYDKFSPEQPADVGPPPSAGMELWQSAL